MSPDDGDLIDPAVTLQSKDEQKEEAKADAKDAAPATNATAAASGPTGAAKVVPISRAPSASLKEAVVTRAVRFRDIYFGGGSRDGSPALETEGLKQLRTLSGQLSTDPMNSQKMFEVWYASLLRDSYIEVHCAVFAGLECVVSICRYVSGLCCIHLQILLLSSMALQGVFHMLLMSAVL